LPPVPLNHLNQGEVNLDAFDAFIATSTTLNPSEHFISDDFSFLFLLISMMIEQQLDFRLATLNSTKSTSFLLTARSQPAPHSSFRSQAQRMASSLSNSSQIRTRVRHCIRSKGSSNPVKASRAGVRYQNKSKVCLFCTKADCPRGSLNLFAFLTERHSLHQGCLPGIC
jgi:hypothetical protein